VTNSIPFGCLLILPIDTVNCVQMLKASVHQRMDSAAAISVAAAVRAKAMRSSMGGADAYTSSLHRILAQIYPDDGTVLGFERVVVARGVQHHASL
jgi:hypothetical protein